MVTSSRPAPFDGDGDGLGDGEGAGVGLGLVGDSSTLPHAAPPSATTQAKTMEYVRRRLLDFIGISSPRGQIGSHISSRGELEQKAYRTVELSG
jgi:hypothetical protein